MEPGTKINTTDDKQCRLKAEVLRLMAGKTDTVLPDTCHPMKRHAWAISPYILIIKMGK